MAVDTMHPKPFLHWLPFPFVSIVLYSSHRKPSHWGNYMGKTQKELE